MTERMSEEDANLVAIGVMVGFSLATIIWGVVVGIWLLT